MNINYYFNIYINNGKIINKLGIFVGFGFFVR